MQPFLLHVSVGGLLHQQQVSRGDMTLPGWLFLILVSSYRFCLRLGRCGRRQTFTCLFVQLSSLFTPVFWRIRGVSFPLFSARHCLEPSWPKGLDLELGVTSGPSGGELASPALDKGTDGPKDRMSAHYLLAFRGRLSGSPTWLWGCAVGVRRLLTGEGGQCAESGPPSRVRGWAGHIDLPPA